MTQQQQQILDVFKRFVGFCEERGLCYWICSGTLIGSVRHGGFIPWDDDLDVMMPLADYQRLLSLAPELPEGLALQNQESDPQFPFLFSKLCDRAAPYASADRNAPWGQHIDIFPLIPSRPLTRGTAAAFSLIRLTEYVIRGKTGWRPYIPHGRAARALYRALTPLPLSVLRGLIRAQVKRIYDPAGAYLCSIAGTYHARVEFSPKAWFAAAEPAVFEGFACRKPVGWDPWLTMHYGDYMQLPPEEKRVSHHVDRT